MRTLQRAKGALIVMKRSAALAAGLALLAGCASGPSLTLSPQPKPGSDCGAAGELAALGIRRVAVLPFASSTERRTETYSAPAAANLPPKPIYRYLPDDGSSAAGAFENALSARRAFTLIERRDLERVHYLEKPLTLEARKTLRAPHAYDAALLGSTVEERIEGLLGAAAREAAALLDSP